MSNITREEIAELRRLCAEATKNWRIREHPTNSEEFFVEADKLAPNHPYNIEVMTEDRHDKLYPVSQARSDANFMVAAREWLPMLLDENERLKKQAADLRDEIGSRVPNQQYLAALATRQASDARGWRPTHRHYKGHLVTEIARGRRESDLTPNVYYIHDGKWWDRPVEEFDGTVHDEREGVAVRIPRFASLPAPPADEDKT